MEGQHERDRPLGMAFRLDDGEDTDPRLAEGPRDLRQHAGTVFDTEPQVKFGNRIRHRLAPAVKIMGREPAGHSGRGQGDPRLGQVAENSARRGILPRAAPVEKRFADHIAPDGHRVENPVHRSQNVGFRDQSRGDAHFDLVTLVRLDRGDKFDPVAELVGKPDVRRRDFFNSLDQNIRWFDPEPVGQRGENDRLVRSIPAVDIERGVGLRVAKFPGLLQRRAEIHSGIGHAGQDVVARAVQDPVDRLEPVSDERLADGFDDRDPARHRGLEKHRHILRRRQLEDFLPVLREKRLVRGDHDLARLDRPPDEPERKLDPSH